MKWELLASKLGKFKYAGLTMIYFALSGTRAFAETDAMVKCQSGVSDQAWLLKLGTLISDPVKWIAYAAAATTVISLSIGFFKLRGAKGRQDKVDEAMKFFWYFGAGSFGIFSVTGISGWFLGKLC